MNYLLIWRTEEPNPYCVTVRVRKGNVSVTDGPSAQTNEQQIGGVTVITARDLNEAIQVASRLPAVLLGSVEVWPMAGGGPQP